MMKSDSEVVIVTAFKELNRANWDSISGIRRFPKWLLRDTNDYFENFERLCQIKNKIVVFADPVHHSHLKSLRDDLIVLDLKEIWNRHLAIREGIQKIHQNPEFAKFVNSPKMPEYWNTDYVYINFLKSPFVAEVAAKETEQKVFAWVDFGYVRPGVELPENHVWRFNPREKMCLFARKSSNLQAPIFEVIKTGVVCIQGGMMIGPQQLWPIFAKHFMSKVEELLRIGLVDDDQSILLMMYQSNPSSFNLLNFDDTNWFQGFGYSDALSVN